MAGIKERLIQVILRGKDLLSPEAKKGKAALDELRESGEQLRTELDKAKEDNNLARSLISLGKESEKADKTAERTAAKVIQLRDELDKNPDSKGLAASLKSAHSEAERAQKALDALKVKTSDFSEKAKAAGIDTSKLSDEEKRLAAELDKAKKAVTDNTKATKDLERNQRSAARAAAEQAARNTSLVNVLKSAEKKVLAYAGAYISLRAASRLASKGLDLVRAGIEKVISVGNGAEKAKIQLEGLMGSIEGGEQATAWIEDFADKTGQRIDDVIEAFAELKAYGLDPMDGSMQSIIDKAAQLGGETEKLKGISLAIGQMWAKEKIVQEEVNQLRERGVNAFALLSTAMNKNVSELQDMAKAGQLGRNEIKLLIDEMGRSAEGQAARSLETLSGKWNVLINQFQKFGEDVASNGAMDIVKEKLQDVLDTVVELSGDGTLDNLAEALSGAFVDGIVKVEKFAASLSDVDFKKLTDDSAAWLSDFGAKIDDAQNRVQLFFAPFSTLFNLVHSGFAATGAFVLALTDTVLSGVQKIGNLLPEALGGKKLAQSMYDMRTTVRGVFDGLVQDILDNNDDIAKAWDISTDKYEDNQSKQSAAARKAEREKQAVLKETEAGIDALFAKEQTAADAYRLAAVEGKRAIEDMADAMHLIDSTESVDELERLRKALLKAYQEGRISQQEFEQGTGVLNGKIKQLGTATAGAAKDFKTLNGVMDAIAKSVNDLDIRQAKAALDKLYREGKISAEEHAKAQLELNKKVAELKVAAESSTKAVKEQGKALKETAGSAKGTASAVSDVGSAAEEAATGMNFFDEVLSRARTPLAEMSAAALDAFDALSGINKLESSFDTSSLDKTTESLGKARNAVAGYQTELGLIGSRGSGFGIWAMQTLERSEQIKVSFLSQKAALQALQKEYESGALSAEQFANKAADARKQFDLLDDSDLSALEGAVDAAKQKMDQLADSTKSTLQSLNDELLQLKGTQEEIEKSKMDSRRRDLQSQLVEARKDGDDRAVKNLQQALNTLSEIESERERVARNKKADDAKAEAEKAAQEQPAKKQEPTKIIKLQVGSQSVDVGVGSTNDEAALLSILEQAGLRSM